MEVRRSEQISCEERRPMGGQERTGQEELWSREAAAGQEGDRVVEAPA